MARELPEVRIAQPAEEEEILEMCRHLWQENGMFSLNIEKVRVSLRKCFERQGAIVGVIGTSGRLEASTCMMISSFHYSDDWHLEELWNFVEPQYRKSKNAEALIEFGKACSDKMKIPLITGVITNKHMAGKVRLYRRLLGYPAGAFFAYNASFKSEPMEDHSELRARLKEFAQMCNDKRLDRQTLRRDVAPLLREAANAISAEDNLWGGVTKHPALPAETAR